MFVLVSVARDLYVGAGIRLGTVGLSVGTTVLGDGGRGVDHVGVGRHSRGHGAFAG